MFQIVLNLTKANLSFLVGVEEVRDPAYFPHETWEELLTLTGAETRATDLVLARPLPRRPLCPPCEVVSIPGESPGSWPEGLPQAQGVPTHWECWSWKEGHWPPSLWPKVSSDTKTAPSPARVQWACFQISGNREHPCYLFVDCYNWSKLGLSLSEMP